MHVQRTLNSACVFAIEFDHCVDLSTRAMVGLQVDRLFCYSQCVVSSTWAAEGVGGCGLLS